jgi:hypothetical protein
VSIDRLNVVGAMPPVSVSLLRLADTALVVVSSLRVVPPPVMLVVPELPATEAALAELGRKPSWTLFATLLNRPTVSGPVEDDTVGVGVMATAAAAVPLVTVSAPVPPAMLVCVPRPDTLITVEDRLVGTVNVAETVGTTGVTG